jgi:hypothetical protein
VNGSPNSLPPTLIETKRETVIAVKPMSKQQIESIPEFKGLIGFLKSHNLDDPVWKVFGGSPADYLKLEEAIIDNKLSLSDTASEEVVDLVKNRLHYALAKAHIMIIKSSSTTKLIIKIFRRKKITKIPMAELEAMGFLLDFPNKVFREVDTVRIHILSLPLHDYHREYSKWCWCS